MTRQDGFDYPVCFDEMDEFNHLNLFPRDMMFQTFLLDKEDKVVAIGNPVQNPKIKVTYEAEKAEHFNKTVTVYCNTQSSPIRLKVKGISK